MEKASENQSSISMNSAKEEPPSIKNLDFIKQTRKLVVGKSQKERFAIAKAHVFNALDFKKLRLDLMQPGVSRWTKIVYNVQTNFMWKTLLFFVAYLFMYAAFSGHIRPSTPLLVIQFILLSILVADISMQIIHKSLKTRLSTAKFQTRFYIRAVSISLLIIDSIIAASTQSLPIRPFLIVRCILPIMYDQQMRKIMYALLASYIDIFVYALFYFSVIIVFGVMANKFIEIPPSVQYDNFTENYGDLGKAIFIMYILTTFDSYPDNQMIAIKLDIWIYGLFILLIFMNALFFVTIPANILMNSIIETRSKTVIIDEIEQQNNLIMAFITLIGDAKMSIPYEKVTRFLLYLFNNEVKYLDKITEICRELDEKVNGSIEVNQFMQICKIIQSKSYLRPPRFGSWKKVHTFRMEIQQKLKLRQFMTSNNFNIFVSLLAIFTFINCFLTVYTELTFFKIIDDIILFIYIIEVCLKFIVMGGSDFLQKSWNIIDVIVICASFFMNITYEDRATHNAAVMLKVVRIFKISPLIHAIFLFFGISAKNQVYVKLTELVNQIAIIIPIVMKFFPLYMISFFFLGTIGAQVYWYESEIPVEDSPYNNYAQFSNFDTLLGSQFIFVQVLTEAGWSMVAFDHAYRYGSYAFTMLFFVFCHMVITIIVTSLMKGVTWEVYDVIQEEHEDYKNKMAEEQELASNLKKRLEIFQQIKGKIQRRENIFPDNLVTRELYEKKIDQQILTKLTQLEEKNKKAFFHKKKKTQKLQVPEELKEVPQEEVPLYKKVLLRNNDYYIKPIARPTGQNQIMPTPCTFLQLPKIRNNKTRLSISRKNMCLDPDSPATEEYERQMDNMIEYENDEIMQIQNLKQQDIEKQIDGVLNQVEIHAGIKFSLKIQYPECFVHYLKAKNKPLRINSFKQDFDIDNDLFARKESMSLLVHGLQTLLQVETTEKEQRGQILATMVKNGLISEEKARKALNQKSEYDNQLSFDSSWIIRKTYLSNINQTKVNQFEIEYFSSIYGKSFKDINKITVYPLLKLQSKLTYCFGNLLRYRQVSTYEFFNTLSHIENKISTKLFQKGSLCKFVYQIDTNSQTWFTVQLKNSNELRVHFIKNGIWIYHTDVKKDEIYVGKDIFNWNQQKTNKQQSEAYIKQFYQTFESLAFTINDFSTFFNPNPEMETYDMYSFYRDVEQSKRYVKKNLSVSKMMLVILSREDERDDPIPYSLSDLKYDDEEMQKYQNQKKCNFRLDETETERFQALKDFQVDEEELISDREGLPYSYIINFMMQIREYMILYEKNFVFHVEKLLNQHFKDSQKMMESRLTKSSRILPQTC